MISFLEGILQRVAEYKNERQRAALYTFEPAQLRVAHGPIEVLCDMKITCARVLSPRDSLGAFYVIGCAKKREEALAKPTRYIQCSGAHVKKT
jgi:hypothetical protein